MIHSNYGYKPYRFSDTVLQSLKLAYETQLFSAIFIATALSWEQQEFTQAIPHSTPVHCHSVRLSPLCNKYATVDITRCHSCMHTGKCYLIPFSRHVQAVLSNVAVSPPVIISHALLSTAYTATLSITLYTLTSIFPIFCVQFQDL